MSLLEALFLGLVQGATEFLPISSSGHLLLVPAVFGLPEPDLNMIAIAHLGTLLAVLVYFRRDLLRIALSTLAGLAGGRPMGTPDARLGWYIVVGSIPAAVLGLSFEDTLDETLGTADFAAMFLLLTAALLVLGETLRGGGRRGLSEMGWRDAIVIGFAQALALLPGVSRSGSTIVAGMLCGLGREAAARYSFLLGTPVIFGAGLLATLDLLEDPTLDQQIAGLGLTFAAAAVSGYACIHFLMRWIRTRSLLPFAAYCAGFGLLYLLVLR